MPRPLKTLILLGLLALSPLAAQSALRPGEAFTFKVTWGLLGTVGEIRVHDDGEPADQTVAVSVDTRSAGVAKALFPFEGTVTSYFDPANGRLLRATAETKSRRKNTSASVEFDYALAEARYTDHFRPKRNATLPLPEQQPLELITGLIRARDLNLAPGDTRRVSILFDDEFYDLDLKAGDYEQVRTADGRVRALRITPEPVGQPKGMFRKGGAIHVWLADDAERLPVRIEVALKVGTAVALLTEHELPTATRASAVETAMVSPPTQVRHTPLPHADRL